MANKRASSGTKRMSGYRDGNKKKPVPLGNKADNKDYRAGYLAAKKELAARYKDSTPRPQNARAQSAAARARRKSK